MNVSSSAEVTVRIRADARAVYGWWVHPQRLEEMRARWALLRDFRWQQTRDADRIEIETGWISPAGRDVALHLPGHDAAAAPPGRRQHPGRVG